MLQSFCSFHDQLCCKVCVKITHNSCDTEEISNLATNIQHSEELDNLDKKLNILKSGFSKNVNKTKDNNVMIEKNHSNTMQHLEKLQDIITEAKTQAERVREEDLQRIEKVTDTCEVIVEQIDKTQSNLAELKESGDFEKLFISMKRAESLQSLDTILDTMNTDNKVSEYKIVTEDDAKLIIDELKLLVHIFFQGSKLFSISTTNMLKQRIKLPIDEEDLYYGCYDIAVFEILPNKQILTAKRSDNCVNLIDINRNKTLSKLSLPDHPSDITKMNADEVAVTIPNSKLIKFLNINQNTLSSKQDIKVNDECTGLAFNSKDQTLIVTYHSPPKIEIMDLAGNVIRTFAKNDKGDQLFKSPDCIALSPDMSEMYITDSGNKSVILMTLSGEVKNIYMGEKLQSLGGLSVHKSGIVYVVNGSTKTVYQIEPDSGEIKLLLQDDRPRTVDYCYNRPRRPSYCDYNPPSSIKYCDYPQSSLYYCHKEDKLYVGYKERNLKVYKMQGKSQIQF